MKIQNKNNRKVTNSNKKYILAAVLTLVAAAIAVGYFYYNKNSTEDQTENSRNDSAQTNSAKDEAEDFNTNNSGPTDKTPTQDPMADKSPLPESGPYITMSKYIQENSQVTTNVEVYGQKANSTCQFTFSHDDTKPVIRKEKVNGTSCSTTVPEVEFSMTGLWRLNVTLYDGSKKIAETNQNVTVN